MNFLYPAFLLGALAVAIPVVLHFLRRDVAPEVPFSAVRLLHRSPIARSRRRRLRDLLLLAARVAALLLLAAAFARPYISSAASAAPIARIVAIDRSFSMGAPGRFARALELARQEIGEAGPGERITVLAFDDGADVIAGPGAAGEARAALAGLQAGFGGTRYGPLMAKAAEVADGAAGRLVVITDLQRTGWEDEPRALLPRALQVVVKDAGAPPANLAVMAIRVESDRVLASIRNSTGEARSGPVRVERDGRPVATATYHAAPDSIVEVPIAYRTPGSGSISVTIDDPAGFAADNARYAVLDPARRPSALVVTSGTPDSGFYLSRALSAASDDTAGDALDARLVAGGAVSAMSAADLARHGAVVLLSTRGLDRRARESLAGFVRAGGGLLIAASPDVEPVVLSTIFDWRPALSAGEAADPVEPVGDRSASSDLPAVRGAGGESRADPLPSRVASAALTAGMWPRGSRNGTPALLERREGQGRVVLLRIRRRSPLERFSAAHGVRAVCGRSRAVRVRGARSRARLCGRASAPGRAGRGPASTGPNPTSARSPSTWIRARASPRGSARTNSRACSIASPPSRARIRPSGRSKSKRASATGNMASC